MAAASLPEWLGLCLDVRAALFDPEHESAFRLFNGFTEGFPDLTIDLYASTVILTNHADPPLRGNALVAAVLPFLQERLPWIQTVILKIRNSKSAEEKRGKIIFGTQP